MSVAWESSDVRRLRKLWQEWTTLISRASLPGWRHKQMTEDQLTRVRQPLLRICSQLISEMSNREQRGLILRMYELVEPWTTPKSFVNVDQKYLASLISECRALGRELKGLRRYRRRTPVWLGPVLVAALIGTVVWFLGGVSGVLGVFGVALGDATRMLRSTSFVQRFALATFCVIAVGIVLLRKTRSY